jgi:hypothetical protein
MNGNFNGYQVITFADGVVEKGFTYNNMKHGLWVGIDRQGIVVNRR